MHQFSGYWLTDSTAWSAGNTEEDLITLLPFEKARRESQPLQLPADDEAADSVEALIDGQSEGDLETTAQQEADEEGLETSENEEKQEPETQEAKEGEDFCKLS